MGRKLLMFTQSTLGFFGTGVTAAILSAAGTTPVFSESFIILKTTGHSDAKHDLNRQVGIGSTMEVATFICETTLPRETGSSKLKFEKKVLEKLGILGAEADATDVMDLRALAILELK